MYRPIEQFSEEPQQRHLQAAVGVGVHPVVGLHNNVAGGGRGGCRADRLGGGPTGARYVQRQPGGVEATCLALQQIVMRLL